MRRTHHISGAHPPNAGREIHGGTQRRSFLRRPFAGGGVGAGRRAPGTDRAKRDRQPAQPYRDRCGHYIPLDKARLPTHINIRAADTGLAKDSVVLLEQIRTLDKHRLRERAGQITPEDQKRVDQALDVSLGLTSY